MFYLVDGTGDDDLKKYTSHMTHGHCDRMAKWYGGKYYRGPTLSGTSKASMLRDAAIGSSQAMGMAGFAVHLIASNYDTSADPNNIGCKEILERVWREVRADLEKTKSGGRLPIHLAGHSRGGAIVIALAKRLKTLGEPVHAMYLFDAVERTADLADCTVIPSNVRIAYHALRDQSLSQKFTQQADQARNAYIGEVVDVFSPDRASRVKTARLKYQRYRDMDDAMRVRMRASWELFSASIPFGNCGTEHESGGQYLVLKKFAGSHGAIGGSPIGFQDRAWTKTDKQKFREIGAIDQAAVDAVGVWMLSHADKEGLANHNGPLS